MVYGADLVVRRVRVKLHQYSEETKRNAGQIMANVMEESKKGLRDVHIHVVNLKDNVTRRVVTCAVTMLRERLFPLRVVQGKLTTRGDGSRHINIRVYIID